ncbi:hypothetical protein CRUP_013121 [Coryphaenoides rupestris]|nr:hypothetical protein CRUP_013121 [Coryphaenoides rupestris]
MCGASEWACHDGSCVSASARCNQVIDCADASDEKSCMSHTQQCEEGHIACPSGKCISSVWLCDGQKDCEDGADEFQCAQSMTWLHRAEAETQLPSWQAHSDAPHITSGRRN